MNALILVDIQNDFIEGGALAVPGGKEVIPVANRLMPHFPLVVATQDFHPGNHGSFASNHPGKKPGEFVELNGLNQILWPDHCAQGTPGADFADDLDIGAVQRIFQKGTDPAIDSYSGFFDNGHRKATGLGEFLKERGVDNVTVVGLATDYCVKFTALDALQLGFGVTVVEDGCRGVNLEPGDADAALDEIRSKGGKIITSREVIP